MNKFLFEVEKKCPLCEESFHSLKVRNRLIQTKRHSDFCIEYEGVNPYLYSVWVCPHCGYAAEEAYFLHPTERDRQKLTQLLANKKIGVDFGGERTLPEGIATFKIGIYQAENIHVPLSRLAGMYLRLAWLLRMQQDPFEIKCLDKAREYFERAFYKETLPLGGKMDGVTVKYLIGDLCNRTNRPQDALRWFSTVVYDRSPGAKQITEMAREQWQKLRAQAEEKDDSVPASEG